MNSARNPEGPGLRNDGHAAVAAPGRVRGRPVALLLRRVQASSSPIPHPMHPAPAATWPGAVPGACGHRLHLPDAPGDAAGPSGRLPEVRHGARARAAEPRRRREPGAGRLPAAASGGRLPLTLAVTVLAMFGHRLRLVRHGARRAGSSSCSRCRSCCGPAGRSSSRGVQSIVNRSPNMWTLIGLGHRRGLRLQRGRHGRARRVPGLVRVDGAGRGVLRGGGGDHLADAARPDARAEGALADLGGDQVAARPGAEDGAAHRRRRQRRGRAARPRARRRRAARAARREGAGRRRRGRGQQRRRRIDADRRADAGDQARRRQARSARR